MKDVLVIVDREQGGVSNLQKEKVQLWSLATTTNILQALIQAGRISKQEGKRILDYLAK